MCGIAGATYFLAPLVSPSIRELDQLGGILTKIYLHTVSRGPDCGGTTVSCAGTDGVAHTRSKKLSLFSEVPTFITPDWNPLDAGYSALIQKLVTPYLEGIVQSYGNSATPTKTKTQQPFASTITNFRGIPITEICQHGQGLPKQNNDEIQPFVTPRFAVVHNGIISNDKEWPDRLMQESKDLYDHDIDSYAILKLAANWGHGYHSFTKEFDLNKYIAANLEGSFAYAILDRESGVIHLNRTFLGLSILLYRFHSGNMCIFFASDTAALENAARECRGGSYTVMEIPPYTSLVLCKQLFSPSLAKSKHRLQWELGKRPTDTTDTKKSVGIILSGGLDSTVTVAHYLQKGFQKLVLFHFLYQCIAQEREKEAVEKVASFFRQKYPLAKIEVEYIEAAWLGKLGGSTLTTSRSIAKGEHGAETCSEWVPARNLVMISTVAAYADVKKLDIIALGLNREEASVFCDNSTEFFESLNLPLQLGTQQKPTIECPLGNMMKHHIVSYGHSIKAPLHLTWSCYHGEKTRCGNCGKHGAETAAPA